jgi:hypothetical protein
MRTIEPVREREPFFDSWETKKFHYAFSCSSCGTEAAIEFDEILESAWGWKENTEQHLKWAIASHFGIDLTNKYIDLGMDAVVVWQCAKCSHKTFVYFWFHEYRNSCYQISLRGLSSDET